MGQCPCFSLLQVSELACPAPSLPWEGRLGSGRETHTLAVCWLGVEQLSGESKRKSCEVQKMDFREQGSGVLDGWGWEKVQEEGGSFGRVSDTAPVLVPASKTFAREVLALLTLYPSSELPNPL